MKSMVALVQRHRADALMSAIVFVWGLNFIVIKDALNEIDPLTYNAVRFAVGTPALTVIALRDRSVLRVSRRDLGLIALATLVGPIGYQVFFVLGLDRTTSTNSALLVATMPAWTAVISIAIGLVMIRRRLMIGLAITLVGVALVILGRAGAGVSFSENDLIGSGLVLLATIVSAIGNILKKPLLDRLGGMRITLWSFWITTLGLVIIAAPNLITLSADDLPVSSLPNVLYSGLLAGVGGFTAMNIALRELGPTRAASYHNLTPIIAGLAGVLILGDPVNTGLIIGGPLTLAGVIIVRNNIYLRRQARGTAPPNT
jgi:drug/metabolite transporter (DMT)-like permease